MMTHWCSYWLIVSSQLSELSQEPQEILTEPQLAHWLPFAHPCCIAGKFDGELNLAIWWSTFVTTKLKSANISHLHLHM